jgi:hypothetical protein
MAALAVVPSPAVKVGEQTISGQSPPCDGQDQSPVRSASRRRFDHNVNIPAQPGQAL